MTTEQSTKRKTLIDADNKAQIDYRNAEILAQNAHDRVHKFIDALVAANATALDNSQDHGNDAPAAATPITGATGFLRRSVG